MHAIAFEHGGGPEVLENIELPNPIPTAHDLLIDVVAVGFNNRERLMRQNGSAHQVTVLGFDVAGTIAAVGRSVRGFKVGDRVISHTSEGDSEQVLGTSQSTVKLPDEISFEQGAAIITPGITAYRIVNLFAPIRSGQTVIVKGASGAVGTLVAQLAVQAGADVIGIASEEHRSTVLNNGALRAIAYDQTNVGTTLANVGDIVINVALDGIGGSEDIAMVKPGGLIVSVAFSIPEADKRFRFTHVHPTDAISDAAALKELLPAFVDQRLSLPVGYTVPFTLSGFQEAHRLLEKRHSGRIVASKKAQ